LREKFGGDARRSVGTGARREADDQTNGLVRIVLRGGIAAEAEHHDGRGGKKA
jgi:hypothetical protein